MTGAAPDGRELRACLTAFAAAIRLSDQAPWADRLDILAARLDQEPGEVAAEVLALYSAPDPLDDLLLTYGGESLARTDAEWKRALAYPRLRWDLYESALALWLATEARSPFPPSDGDRAEKLADWGYGNEIWRQGPLYRVRRSTGMHWTLWRDDEIGEGEAWQAALGPRHFDHMVAALERRLKASGLDPYSGTVTPPDDPFVAGSA
jgi:predicted transcriptional regulator